MSKRTAIIRLKVQDKQTSKAPAAPAKKAAPTKKAPKKAPKKVSKKASSKED